MIASAIAKGVLPGVPVEVELDRARAIERALEGAADVDVIVIAGKGHETEQTIGAGKRAFSDPEIVRSLLDRA